MVFGLGVRSSSFTMGEFGNSRGEGEARFLVCVSDTKSSVSVVAGESEGYNGQW